MRGGDCKCNLRAMSSLRIPRFAAPAVMLVIGVLAAIASPASATPRTTPFPLPDEFAQATDLVTGPDGAVWVTDSSLGRIWRIAAKGGKIRSYDLGDMPGGITTAHGSLWVTDSGGSAIHRVETDGSSTHYPLRPGAFPIDIVKGSDGGLWFTEGRGDAIGRLALDGTVTEYPLPTTGAFAASIVAGPDGALYFSEETAGQVGRITVDGAITEYALPGADAQPGPIAVAGGALYVADANNNTIDRMTTAGVFTAAYPLPRENALPLAMVAGPRGALYIAESRIGLVSRMTLDGRFTKRYRIPGGSPDVIATGADDTLWVGQSSLGQVVRLDVKRRH
jgi:virginiamycin B lyase